VNGGDGGLVPVKLNVYNVGESRVLRRALTFLKTSAKQSAFHCGVDVHNCEWSYGGEERQWGFNWNVGAHSIPTGITCSVPCESLGHIFSESILLGKTAISEDNVVGAIQRMGRSWPAADHDPVTRSCIHFCDALCQLLGVSKVPERVRDAAVASRMAARGEDCCNQVLCSCQRPDNAQSNEEDLAALRLQLEHANTRLRMTQRALATERASHDEAIRQVLDMRRQFGGSEGGISPRSPRQAYLGGSP